MRRLVVTRNAKRDIDAILAQSQARFGITAADRYRRLIDRALHNLVADPGRNGVHIEAGLPAAVRLYPLRLASQGAPRGERVNRARHVVAFSFDADEVVVVRLLHDRMDAKGQLGG